MARRPKGPNTAPDLLKALFYDDLSVHDIAVALKADLADPNTRHQALVEIFKLAGPRKSRAPSLPSVTDPGPDEPPEKSPEEMLNELVEEKRQASEERADGDG